MEHMVRIRAHRVLRRGKRYENLLDSPDTAARFEHPPLDQDEYMIGVYTNDEHISPDQVLVSSTKFYIGQPGAWLVIPFVDIIQVIGPPDKVRLSGLNLVLRDDRTIKLPIYGADRNTRDAYTYWTFIKYVISDLQDE